MDHHHTILNGLDFHFVTDGPEDGKPVLLLHGFPEFWYGWRHQIPALAEAGYRVIVPDQRGYNLSARPTDVAAYDLDRLATDILALVEHFGYQRVKLVGHDWGAAVAWWLAIHYPEVIEKLAILNVPHPSVMSSHLRKDIRQLLKSWYIFFFQIPRLPEFLLGMFDNAGLANLLRRSGKVTTFSESDIKRYREAWRQPGALTGMLNWYRALFRRASQPMPGRKIDLPVLILWGEQDVALRAKMAKQSLRYCTNGRLAFFPEATHWVQHDAAEQINARLIDFLR